LSWEARGLSAPTSKEYDEKKRPTQPLIIDDGRQRMVNQNSFEERRKSPKPTLLPPEVLRGAAARNLETYSGPERAVAARNFETYSGPERAIASQEENRGTYAGDNKTIYVGGIDNTPTKKPSDYRDVKPKIPTQDNRTTITQGRQENSESRNEDWRVVVPNEVAKESDDDLLARQRLAEVTKIVLLCACALCVLTFLLLMQEVVKVICFAAFFDDQGVLRFDQCCAQLRGEVSRLKNAGGSGAPYEKQDLLHRLRADVSRSSFSFCRCLLRFCNLHTCMCIFHFFEGWKARKSKLLDW
jgi:hypothetical protein